MEHSSDEVFALSGGDEFVDPLPWQFQNELLFRGHHREYLAIHLVGAGAEALFVVPGYLAVVGESRRDPDEPWIAACGMLFHGTVFLFISSCFIRASRVAPIDSEDTLAFSVLENIRPMIETAPLEQAADADVRMMQGKARFRMALVAN